MRSQPAQRRPLGKHSQFEARSSRVIQIALHKYLSERQGSL